MKKNTASIAFGNRKAIIWMMLYTIVISGMHICVQLVSEGMHPFQIAFFRNIFGLVVVIPWFVKYGLQPLKTKKIALLLTRGGLNSLAMLGFFYGLAIIPLAEATALTFTAPIFATLMGIFFFNERIGFLRWSAIFFGLAGVIVVLRPGFHVISYGQFLVLTSSFTWGACMIIIKTLGKTESAVTITSYMSLVMAPLTLIPASFFWISPTLDQILLLILLGSLGGVGQLALAEALRLGETHVVSPFDFSRLIFVSLLGYIFLNQLPDIFVWVGGTMIFSSIAFIAWREHIKIKENKT